MKVEVPECKRCFCCIPLRYGLLFWGYVKLIASFILLGLLICLTIITANRMQRLTSTEETEYYLARRMSFFIWDLVWIVVLTLIVLLEISINIVFIVGGHKKSPKLMKVFYYYNIVMLCLYIFAFSVSTTIDLMFQLPYVLRFSSIFPMAAFYIRVKIGAGLLNAVIQIYFILLTRSEVRKLQNNSTFHFNNNAAEAQCKMESEFGHNIEQQSNDLEKITEIKINDVDIDVVRNNNVNTEKDYKLKLNKYKQIKNTDVE